VLVIPLLWMPDVLAPALPCLALGVLAYRERRIDLLPVVGLSLPFVLLMWLANTDWYALFGLGGPGFFAPFLLTVKPQATGLVLVTYLHPQRWVYLVPLALAALVAFALWRWPLNIVEHQDTIIGYGHNWALWRHTWPLGLWAVWRAWRDRSVMWGCVASVLLTPYLALYSLVPTIYVVAREHRRAGIALSLSSWIFALL
jgi:hypothetical protein